ncbi:hypothetical protein B9G53_16605 [Pseudanabaena sp. SR411]|uniref:class I SAM-dependent methyltransferase n=1 Tax=Pseudanabaena sp. SR411 TaxID=1980935 RepID=UPI000B98717A|nr:class I SAM-dependent methyltransferase [Pseudanabaena sp. SR411]OYQ63515.1 hypothetical protein B9G53_16605 [Pseudanabaena sp. SR411]
MPKSKLLERTNLGLHDSLVEFLPNISHNVSILDIGCGTGAWLERLADRGFSQLHGIDLNIEQFGCTRATCLQANLDYDDLGLGTKKFGLISAIELVEHLENQGRLFYHVSNHLDDNGYFLLTTPNIHSINCRFKFLITGELASFDKKGDQTHIVPIYIDCLERVLSHYSLKIVKCWGYPTHGSIKFTKFVRIVSTILQPFLPNKIAGDNLCVLIKKA